MLRDSDDSRPGRDVGKTKTKIGLPFFFLLFLMSHSSDSGGKEGPMRIAWRPHSCPHYRWSIGGSKRPANGSLPHNMQANDQKTLQKGKQTLSGILPRGETPEWRLFLFSPPLFASASRDSRIQKRVKSMTECCRRPNQPPSEQPIAVVKICAACGDGKGVGKGTANRRGINRRACTLSPARRLPWLKIRCDRVSGGTFWASERTSAFVFSLAFKKGWVS